MSLVQKPSSGSTIASDELFAENTVEIHEPILRKTWQISLEKGCDGWIVAKCLNLTGVVTQGKTEEEAIKNAIEATELMLEELNEDKEFNVMVARRPSV